MNFTVTITFPDGSVAIISVAGMPNPIVPQNIFMKQQDRRGNFVSTVGTQYQWSVVKGLGDYSKRICIISSPFLGTPSDLKFYSADETSVPKFTLFGFLNTGNVIQNSGTGLSRSKKNDPIATFSWTIP